MRRCLVAAALCALLLPLSPAEEQGVTPPEHLSIFLIDQQSRPRLLPGSTRFEDSVLRQANLTDRAALRRYAEGPINACLARAFDSLATLCRAEPAPLEPGEDDATPESDSTSPRTIELPSTFKRPEPPSAEDAAASRAEALPAPKPPARSLRCSLSSFRGPLGVALRKRVRESEVQSVFVSLLLTTKLPPSRADKREYWRLYGTRRDYQNETEARAGAADTRAGREFDGPNDLNYDVEVNDFERQIPDFDNAPPLLRLQLRGEAADGHVELLAGRLLAKLPRATEDDVPFDAERCTVDADKMLGLLGNE